MRTLKVISLSSLLSLTFCFLPQAQAVIKTKSVSAIKTQTTATIFIQSQVNPGTTVLYSCDGLESTAQNLLKKLGATNISTDCSGEGGASDRPSFSPTLILNFTVPRLPGPGISGPALTAHWQNVTLSGFDDCEAVRQIVSGFKDQLSVQNFQGSLDDGACFGTDSPYHYSLEVLVSQ
jgi:hypothetical protein